MNWTFYALLAMFMQGFLLFLIKLLSIDINPLNLLLLQYAGGLVLVGACLLIKRINIKVKYHDLGLILLSGFLVSTGLAFYYIAISLISVSRVVPFHNVGITLLPVFLAFTLLKEKINRRLVLGISCSVLSIIFLTI